MEFAFFVWAETRSILHLFDEAWHIVFAAAAQLQTSKSASIYTETQTLCGKTFYQVETVIRKVSTKLFEKLEVIFYILSFFF